MAMQQLDLFAAFGMPSVQEEQPKAAAKKKAAPKVEPQLVVPEAKEALAPAVEEAEAIEQPADEIIIDAPEPAAPVDSFEGPADEVIVAAPAPAAPIIPVETPVVFSDDKIAVKIKSKVSVQMPVTEQRQVIVTSRPAEKSIAATVVKLKSKRGRKSYKEIDAELDLIEVPEDEVLHQKLYYSITEVAKWFKVNASLLRYWENEFDILKPRKNRKGDRLFRPEDIKNLQVIYYLLRNRKFSIEGAKKYLRNNRQQADVHVQLAQSLTKFRSFLLELKANLGS